MILSLCFLQRSKRSFKLLENKLNVKSILELRYVINYIGSHYPYQAYYTTFLIDNKNNNNVVDTNTLLYSEYQNVHAVHLC